MSGGLQAPCLPVRDRGGWTRGDEQQALSSFEVLRFHFLLEGHGATPSWEAPENLPKKSMIKVT